MELVPILWWGLAILLIVGGLVGTIYPLLPGVPMIFIGMWIGAWVDGYARVGTKTLVFLGVLTAFSVILDFIASALGARRVGASKQAVTGALIGSIAGMFTVANASLREGWTLGDRLREIIRLRSAFEHECHT